MTTFEETVDEPLEFGAYEFGDWGETLTDDIAITETAPFYYYRIVRELLELVQWRETQAVKVTWHPVMTQRIGLSVRLLKLYDSVTLTQAMTVSQDDAYYAYALRELTENIELGDSLEDTQRFIAILTQAMRLAHTQKVYGHVTLTQNFTVHDAAALYQYAQIIERLGIADAVSMPWRVYASLTEQVEMIDGLARYLGARIEDVIALVENVTRRRRITPTLNQNMTITENLSRGLLLRVVANDTVEITHADAIKMLFQPTLADALEIVSTYLDPEGITTWTVNLSHGGVTEYSNFNFNSFARMGNKYIAASDEGLYELNGADDDGDDIIARLKSGMLQFGKSNYSSFKGIYLGLRGGGDFVLKLVTGDGKSYTYSVEARTMETTKVNVGKGLRARYFSYELISTGQDFDMDSIEFIPIVAKRRV